MGRPLTGMELGLWRVDLACSLNFTTIARVSGPLSDDALRAALPALQARHPHLRHRIDDEGNFVDDVQPLTLRIGTEDWVKELEHELNTVVRGAPLGRFVRVGDRLLITLHHCIGDGMSGVFLMRDWLKAATGGTLEPLTDRGGVDTLVTSAPGLSNNLRFLARDAWVLTTHGKPLKIPREEERFAYDRKTRVTHVSLEAELVTALSARAREEKTTVHGALSAAMLQALLHDARRGEAGVFFGSPVNVRAQLGLGEELGFYVSMLAYRAAIHAHTPFWEQARLIRRALEADLAAKQELSLIQFMPKLWRVMGGNMWKPRALAEGFENLVPTTSGLTNLGRLAVQTSYGDLTLEECHFAACPSALGDFLATATSLHGRLFWNFLWPTPVISEAHAQRLVDDIVRRVRDAVS